MGFYRAEQHSSTGLGEGRAWVDTSLGEETIRQGEEVDVQCRGKLRVALEDGAGAKRRRA